MPHLSPEEMGIKKDDLTPRDRLMMIKKEVGLQQAMENLANAFGDIASIKEATSTLEEMVKRVDQKSKAEQYERVKTLLEQYEKFINLAERNHPLDPIEVGDWVKDVDLEAGNFRFYPGRQTRRDD